ncbi:MAG: IS3 family transposase [Clostridia bacterium]|nr:IS3 family transposase [Clostridia bacterium]
MKNIYSAEQKQAIIDRYISDGESSASILADTGIPKSTFYSWLRAYQKERSASQQGVVSVRNFRFLENKVARLEGIIEILKSAKCTPSAPLKQRLYIAEQFHGRYSVRMICDAFGIPRGTFYNHVLRNKKDNTWYSKRREEFRIRIQEIYDESNQIFGAGKIVAVMENEGIKVSEKMVRTLMRDMGLVSIRQSAKKLYDDECRKYKNYLNQEFDVSKPNEVWVSDVTYFKYGDNSYYICAIIDLFSRMVIAYKVGKTNSTQLVKSTFKKAYELRQPDSSLIFHTDRGCNYRSKTMHDYIRSLNITHSFSRAYVPYDNSVMETFFASMKREELYRTKYRSELDFRNAVDKYILFSNTKRPHRKLLYKTPLQKEEEYVLKIEES